MKVIDEGIGEVREPIAAVCDDGFGKGGQVLVFRQGNDSALVVWDDFSGGERDEWDEFLEEHPVLKFYYPGDRITIEV